MVATEEQQRRGRIQTFLTETETPRTLAERLVASNPWLCEQIGVDFAEWAKPVLAERFWKLYPRSLSYDPDKRQYLGLARNR